VQARNQAIWLRPLDDQALIEIATRVDSPVEHWQTILDSIERLPEVDRENLVNLSPELLSTTWLPTRFDAPVAPEYVLNLPPAFKDQATRLVAAHQAIHRPCFAVPEDLADAVRQHPGFAWLQENAFSKERSGLERLARLLTDLPEQQIGDWKTPTKAMIELLANFPQLPGWALLRDAIAAFPDTEHSRTISFLWDGLKGAPAGEKILAVLNWLTSETNRWNERKIAVDGYLRQFIAEDIRPENWLARIKLASQTHTWEDPQDLCAGAIGVDPAQTLDRMQADILKKLIYCVDQQLGKDDAQDINEERGIAWFERMRAAAPQVFERAFEGWQSLIDRPMIGAIAGLLGTELRQIASAWLHPHSFDWLKNQLRPSWRDPGQNNNRIEWMGGRTLDQALESIEVGMVLAVGDSKKLINLLGEPIQVRLQAAKDIQHLVVVAPQWKGGCRVKIDLRRVDPINQSSDRLADLLRRTAECIYENFYNQPKPDFGALWNDLEQTRQLDIATARRMILDNIAFYLRQLSIRDDNLKKLLTCCDNAQQRLAELQEDHGKDNSSYLSTAERTYREAIDTLGHKIENDQALRDAVLAGVRSRVRDSQYRSDSIPFEMFQNADDAVVELGQIQAYPDTGCEIPDTARRLVIEYGPERLRLLHWGRSLNDRGPMGFKGDERGFGRDLKKMLVLSGSDKHPDAGVTGRLGLGFKSVLLVCDRPRIVSGRLAVEIVGGILPASWFDPAEARECLRRNSNEYPTLPGTLIELTAVDDAKQREVLKRFKRLAGMLCVFARAIRRIDLRGEHTEAPGRHYQWSPTELVAGLEIGSLHLESPDWGNQSNALCLRTDQGSLLFALGPSGFRPLPDDVPAVWVTAPTIESAVLGFAINGSFGLDPGRARLAAENAENLERAERLGTATGLIMKKLLEATTDEWPQYRERLQLAAELNAHDFWKGVWIGLTQMWLGRQRDAAGELARATLRQLIETLADLPRAVPNGLPNPHGAMVSKQDIRFELAAALGTAEVASTLYYWPRFIARYERAATVTEAIGAILKHCQLATLTSIGPAALLKLCNEQVEPVDAVALGRILDETEDAIPWDKGDLRDLLRKMQFRAQDGSWKSAHQLLTDGRLGGESAIVEEQMRFAVAPLDRRLRGEYADQPDGAVAIELFMRCRERLEADARELATWIRAAEDDTLRIASLQLLARSDRRGEIAAQVRGRDWLISARGRDELLQAAQLTLPEQAELRRLLAGDDLIHRAIQIEMAAAESSPVDVGWNIDLKTALERIYDWWGQNREDLGQEYQKKLYPWEVNLTENVETGRICRSSWLTLFALGAFQSVSWRDDGRNRNFLALCKDRGWWQIFSERDPRDCPDQWMDIIEQYAESQHDDQQWAEWVAQFPNLYRLARWLDEYIELFKSIERHNAPFAIDSIVAPRAESAYQGGGYDAPPINRTLKVGKHLVIRELLRYRILTNPHAVPYAYAPTAQICRLFRGFAVEVESSTAINQLLVQHLCADHAKFQNDYDVPLRLVAGDPGLQAQLFR
jgi:hypothetical protein